MYTNRFVREKEGSVLKKHITRIGIREQWREGNWYSYNTGASVPFWRQ